MRFEFGKTFRIIFIFAILFRLIAVILGNHLMVWEQILWLIILLTFALSNKDAFNMDNKDVK